MAAQPSKQVERYRTAREHGHSRADAAAYAEIPIDEAAGWDRDWGLEPAPTTNRRKP